MGDTIEKGVSRSVGEKKFLLGLGVAYRERGGCKAEGRTKRGEEKQP